MSTDLIYRCVTWEDGVRAAILHAELDPRFNKGFSTDRDYRFYYEHDLWNQIGRKAWRELDTVTVLPYSPLHFQTLLAGKQHDYGPENIMKFGHRGLEVRLWDKVARYENLVLRGAASKHEPLKDTLLDMVGYVIIDNMLMMGTFTLPLKGDIAQERAA